MSKMLYMLWGSDRAAIFDLWGYEEPTEEKILAFFKEYPDSDPLVYPYEFETEAEIAAFLKGSEEQEGWEKRYRITSPEEFALLRKMCEVYAKHNIDYKDMDVDADCLHYLDRLPAEDPEPEEPWTFEECGLDDLVHDVASKEAADTNNGGVAEQVEYLKRRGWTPQTVRERLAP